MGLLRRSHGNISSLPSRAVALHVRKTVSEATKSFQRCDPIFFKVEPFCLGFDDTGVLPKLGHICHSVRHHRDVPYLLLLLRCLRCPFFGGFLLHFFSYSFRGFYLKPSLVSRPEHPQVDATSSKRKKVS